MTKRNPYPRNNFARTEDYLEELVLQVSGERGRVAISEEENGYQDLNVNNAGPKSLTVPERTVSAEIHVEADPTSAIATRAIRYKHNGSAPASSSGMALGNGDVIEVFGKDNLDQFMAIGIETGKSHWLRIQYYASAQKEQ